MDNDTVQWFQNPEPLQLSHDLPTYDLVQARGRGVLPLEAFPLVEDFTVTVWPIRSKDLGMHLRFTSETLGVVASFPWWDRVEKDLARYTAEDIPLGTLPQPYDELEEGWQILIFAEGEYVYVLQGENPLCLAFPTYFKVGQDRYKSEWLRAIRQFNSAA